MIKSSEPKQGEKKCNVCSDFQQLRRKTKKEIVNKMKNKEEQEDFPCPPDSGELGRSTWTFLHTMAAYYPSKPTEIEQNSMAAFIDGLSRFYPCNYCADHLKGEIKINPPTLKSNIDLSDWFCKIHNQVNVRQGKPEFDCKRVFERWKTGRKGCFPE